jgi:hypothetical protein
VIESVVDKINWKIDNLQDNEFRTEFLSDICDLLLEQTEYEIKNSLIDFQDSKMKQNGIVIGGKFSIQDYPIFTDENKFIIQFVINFQERIKNYIDFNKEAREFIKINENLIDDDIENFKRKFCKKILGLIPKEDNYKKFQENI